MTWSDEAKANLGMTQQEVCQGEVGCPCRERFPATQHTKGPWQVIEGPHDDYQDGGLII